jgi:hypothetical protein
MFMLLSTNSGSKYTSILCWKRMTIIISDISEVCLSYIINKELYCNGWYLKLPVLYNKIYNGLWGKGNIHQQQFTEIQIDIANALFKVNYVFS